MLEKQDRRLKDIHVFCQWVVKGPKRQDRSLASSAGESLQKTAFPLSSVYETEEISSLLQSSGSVLSLTLEDLNSDTVSAVWEPDTRSQQPLRRLQSTLQFGDPPRDEQGLFGSETRKLPSSISLMKVELSTRMPGEKAMALIETYSKFTTASFFNDVGYMITPIALTLRSLVKIARNLNEDIMEDLKYMEDSWAQFSNHWIMEQENGNNLFSLSKSAEELVDAVKKYTVWSTAAMRLDRKCRLRSLLSNRSLFTNTKCISSTHGRVYSLESSTK